MIILSLVSYYIEWPSYSTRYQVAGPRSTNVEKPANTLQWKVCVAWTLLVYYMNDEIYWMGLRGMSTKLVDISWSDLIHRLSNLCTRLHGVHSRFTDSRSDSLTEAFSSRLVDSSVYSLVFWGEPVKLTTSGAGQGLLHLVRLKEILSQPLVLRSKYAWKKHFEAMKPK